MHAELAQSRADNAGVSVDWVEGDAEDLPLPDGVFGDFFRIVAGYLPEDPAFVDPPLAWGDAGRVGELFEGTGVSLDFERAAWEITHPSVDAAVACYTDNLGPVQQAHELAAAAGRWTDLRAELAELFARQETDDGRVAFPADYLRVTGQRA